MMNHTLFLLGEIPSDIGVWADIAAIILVGVLIWQSIILTKQFSRSEENNKLANTPFVYPRYQLVPAISTAALLFANVGTKSAIEVHLTLSDADTGKALPPFDVSVLKPDEERPVQINLFDHRKIKIEGSYQNVLGDDIPINLVYDFDKKRAEKSSVETESDDSEKKN